MPLVIPTERNAASSGPVGFRPGASNAGVRGRGTHRVVHFGADKSQRVAGSLRDVTALR